MIPIRAFFVDDGANAEIGEPCILLFNYNPGDVESFTDGTGLNKPVRRVGPRRANRVLQIIGVSNEEITGNSSWQTCGLARSWLIRTSTL